MIFTKTTGIAAAAFLTVIGTGCATKKQVRQIVAPVENRVTAAETQGKQQQGQIGELNNNVSRVDEKAMDADKKALAAGQAAGQANTAAQQAGTRADEARQMAESTRSRIGEVVENIDNYKLVSTENVLFKLNKANLTDEAKQQLDGSVGKVKEAKNYIVEIQGFADPTGTTQHNLTLSQKRADTVVRYLTTNHQVPLRKIHVLGLGEEGQEVGEGREAREQARRVELKVFALDLAAPGGGQAATTTGAATAPTAAPQQ